MATYLVTGGAGFIGSHLCEALLAQHHHVVVIDNLSTGQLTNLPNGVEFIQGDIRDRELLDSLMPRMDGCFHLAAIASVVVCNDDWLTAHEVNVTGTLIIIDSARNAASLRQPIPVVFASSAAVYGASQQLPLQETQPPQPISIYGITKLCCEYYAQIGSTLHHVPCTALRLFNVYGPRQTPNSSYSGVITQFVHKLRNNQPLTIYGDGGQTRDFIYVGDVVQFFCAAMASAQQGFRIFNVCSGARTAVKDIASCLSSVLHVNPTITTEPTRTGDIYHSVGCPELAAQTLQLRAHTALQQGLEALVGSSSS